MGQTLGRLTRDHHLPLLAVAVALLRLKKQQSGTVLGALAAAFDTSSALGKILGDVVGVYVAIGLIKSIIQARRDLSNISVKKVKDAVGGKAMQIIEQIPAAKAKLDAEFSKVEADIEKSLKDESREKIITLPAAGMSREGILTKMKAMCDKEDYKWKDGWVSGAVYHGGKEHMDLQGEVFKLFSVSNPLHPDVWPSVMKFEAEVVSMTANMLNGGLASVCGTMSSGGTESICLATRAHKEFYYKNFGITKPEIIAGVTAHAGIDKACEIFGIKLIHVAVDPVTFKVDVKAVKAALTENTIMIYSSAPNYPSGIVDPLDELSAIAKSHGCGLHVDMCLGGFILPFAKKLGFFDEIGGLNFEFGNLPGMTSASCDTHKYGYSVKGTSVVLYRTPELRRCQYFTYPAWTGGLYATPTIAGSRPGGLSAACWASMIAMGEDGYLGLTRQIMDTQRRIKKAVIGINGIELCGDPYAMIVAFRSSAFNIYSLGDKMHKRGWSLNSLQHPASIHICVTLPVVGASDRFITDLTECTAECMANPGNSDNEGNAPVYGMAAALPAGPVSKMLATYTDVVFKV